MPEQRELEEKNYQYLYKTYLFLSIQIHLNLTGQKCRSVFLYFSFVNGHSLYPHKQRCLFQVFVNKTNLTFLYNLTSRGFKRYQQKNKNAFQ